MQSSMQALPNKAQVLQCQANNPDFDSNFGDVFRVEQLDMPEDLQGAECLVEIRAISLGVADIAALPYMKKGVVPGYDFAGVIRKCNSGMWKEGDRVAGMALGGLSATIQGGKNVERFQPQGACATYVRTMCHLVMKIPDRANFTEAATLPSSLLDAYQQFNLPSWPHKANSHEPILILGAETNYGLCAVQLAHCMEYKVIAVGDPMHQKTIEQFGADQFFDRNTDNLAQKIRDATQDKLRYAHVTGRFNNAFEIATQSMPQGGEISVTPIVMAQYQNIGVQMSQDRGTVKVVERTPVTLFGFDCQMDSKTLRPRKNETDDACKFLKDVTRWLQEEKIRALPFNNVERNGIDGLLDVMNLIRADMDKLTTMRLVSTISGRQGEGMM